MSNKKEDDIPILPTREEWIEDHKSAISKDVEEIDSDIGRWERFRKVFELRKRGVSYKVIGKLLHISERTAKRDYKKYVYLRAKILGDQMTKKDLTDVADALAELEYIKELAYEGQLSSEKDSPAYVANVKMLLETVKQIKELKLQTGIWGRFDEYSGQQEGSFVDRVRKLRAERNLSLDPREDDYEEEEESINMANKMLQIEGIQAIENQERLMTMKKKMEEDEAKSFLERLEEEDNEHASEDT